MIELTNVTRVFNAASGPVVALPRISLSVETSEFLAIEGPSGSGKSTLLNILGLLDRPTGGQYVLDNVDTALVTQSEAANRRAQDIGFVFQAFHLISSLNAIDNVAVGSVYRDEPRAQRYSEAHDVLVSLGLGHRVTEYPRTLSGGERQRVAIARAITGNRRLLIADEPTGNLDHESSTGILDTFERLHDEGLTIVVATHDPRVAEAASRRIRLDAA